MAAHINWCPHWAESTVHVLLVRLDVHVLTCVTAELLSYRPPLLSSAEDYSVSQKLCEYLIRHTYNIWFYHLSNYPGMNAHRDAHYVLGNIHSMKILIHAVCDTSIFNPSGKFVWKQLPSLLSTCNSFNLAIYCTCGYTVIWLYFVLKIFRMLLFRTGLFSYTFHRTKIF